MQLRWRTRMTSGSRKRGRTRLPYTSCQWSEPTGRAPIPRSSDRLEQGRLAETCRRTVTRTRPPRPCELRAAARTMRRVKPATRLVRPEGPGASPPLDRSTTFAYREPRRAYYQRHGHPVGEQAEGLLGELDGGHALLFPSGAAATTALVLSLLRPGSTIALAAGAYYGTGETFRELERWGLGFVEFDQTGPPPAQADLVWLEAPSNPYLTFPDLEAAVAHPSPVLVDATASTPALFRPLEHGADVVLHSATKYLGGHHDVLLGALVFRDDELHARVKKLRGLTGPIAA